MAYHPVMSQHAIEVILTRQLAEYLAVPVFIIDQEGALVFYNEPAERILGMRFEETGQMPAERWGTAFLPRDEEGTVIPLDEVPLLVSLREAKPTRARLFITGLDNVRRKIEIGSWPLIGHGGRMLGAVAMLWELEV